MSELNKYKPISPDKLLSFLEEKRDHRKKYYISVKTSLLFVYKFCKESKIKLSSFEKTSYSFFLSSAECCVGKNECIQSRASQYYDYRLLYRYNNICILFLCPRKYAYKLDFTFKNYEYRRDNVFLDIETTGLNFFLDDVLSISLYQPSTQKSWTKYLPLSKKTHIPENITEINHITDSDLKRCTKFTNKDLEFLKSYFELSKNNLVIWAGANLFDAMFLNVYFIDHNLKYDGLTFVNAGFEAKKFFGLKTFKKDFLAEKLNIDLSEKHTSLGDCKIQSQICEKMKKNERILPISFDAIIDEVATTYETMSSNRAAELYNLLCDFCIMSYGAVDNDYDENPRHIFGIKTHIHHKDEIILDDIAVRTQEAMKNGDIEILKDLKKYNKKDRLVYASIEEHFYLHILMEKIREGNGGGPHYLFPLFYFDAQERKSKAFDTYLQLIKFEKLDINECYKYWSKSLKDEILFNKYVLEFNELLKK